MQRYTSASVAKAASKGRNAQLLAPPSFASLFGEMATACVRADKNKGTAALCPYELSGLSTTPASRRTLATVAAICGAPGVSPWMQMVCEASFTSLPS